jgi:Abortive infection alpha
MDLTPVGTAATVLAAAKAAEPYLLKILGAPLEQIGGLLASPFEEMKKRRSARLAKIAADAAAQVNANGVEPIQVPDYIVLPLLEKATLVDDDGLQKMWASLLANASNPASASSISQVFPTMLAGLSPREAQFLEAYFDAAVYSIFVKIPPIAPSLIAGHSKQNDARLTNLVANSRFRWQSNEEKHRTLDNLVSLGIMRCDHEIPLDDFPKLAKYLLEQAGIRPIKKIDIPAGVNHVPLAEDFLQPDSTGGRICDCV